MSAAKMALEARERPILFGGEMVRAILDGRKTQTRRVVTDRTALAWLAPGMFVPEYVALAENGLSPYGYAGDRLWVRETWLATDVAAAQFACKPRDIFPSNAHVYYPSTKDDLAAHPDFRGWDAYRWLPSIHMPRWASRITLELTDVRVERVQEISEEDAIAEGVVKVRDACHVIPGYDYDLVGLCHTHATTPFAKLWDDINESRGYGWNANPWVWALSFRVVRP